MATRFTSLGVKLTAVIGGLLTLGAGLLVTGTLDFTDTAVIQVDSTTRYQLKNTVCSATGGLTTYTTCSMASPLSTTGTLIGFGVECGNWSKAMSGDVSFKKSVASASGTVLTNGNNISAGTGANLQSNLAVPVSWNPADLLTFTTLVAPTGTLNTTRYDCQMWATLSDKYGT